MLGVSLCLQVSHFVRCVTVLGVSLCLQVCHCVRCVTVFTGVSLC